MYLVLYWVFYLQKLKLSSYFQLESKKRIINCVQFVVYYRRFSFEVRRFAHLCDERGAQIAAFLRRAIFIADPASSLLRSPFRPSPDLAIFVQHRNGSLESSTFRFLVIFGVFWLVSCAGVLLFLLITQSRLRWPDQTPRAEISSTGLESRQGISIRRWAYEKSMFSHTLPHPKIITTPR